MIDLSYSADDLRRGARILLARRNDDRFVFDREVAAVDDWAAFGVACLVLADVILEQTLDTGDEGSDEVWLHQLVATLIAAKIAQDGDSGGASGREAG